MGNKNKLQRSTGKPKGMKEYEDPEIAELEEMF
jgi:hypothetical protein